jgi:hypothetical protein
MNGCSVRLACHRVCDRTGVTRRAEIALLNLCRLPLCRPRCFSLTAGFGGPPARGSEERMCFAKRHAIVLDLDRRHSSSATGMGSTFTPTHQEASSP